VALRAGPVSMDFVNGQLRYLRVNGREVLRRVYFAVRDETWDTPDADFEWCEIDATDDSFRIDLKARVKNDFADYAWSGGIEGRADGSITFVTEGERLTPFESPRIGLCVLYGGEALIGQPYEAIHVDGRRKREHFPRLISPQQFAREFTSFRTTTRENVGVLVVTPGADMNIEDQRNYGDSSYKAFIEGSERHSQRLDIAFDTSPIVVQRNSPPPPISIGAASSAVLPRLTCIDDSAPGTAFVDINRNRAGFESKESVVFRFTTAGHLCDDDTQMENIPAIVPQAATLRSFAPNATLHAAPVLFDPPCSRPGRDSRYGTEFSSAWLLRFAKFAAMAEIAEVSLAFTDGPWEKWHGVLSDCAGEKLLETDVDPHASVEVLALESRVIVANTTDREQTAVIGGVTLDLSAYEVREIS
jgi:hypothetical protein